MSNRSSNFEILTPTEFEQKAIGKEAFLSGMGKLSTAATVAKLYQIRHLILVGFCGALRGCKVGDVIYPIEIFEGDHDDSPIGCSVFKISAAPSPIYERLAWKFGAAGADFVCQDRILLRNEYGLRSECLVTDMETYAFIFMCSKLEINCSVIRIVSDIVRFDSPMRFLKSAKKYAPKLKEVVCEAIKALK